MLNEAGELLEGVGKAEWSECQHHVASRRGLAIANTGDFCSGARQRLAVHLPETGAQLAHVLAVCQPTHAAYVSSTTPCMPRPSCNTSHVFWDRHAETHTAALQSLGQDGQRIATQLRSVVSVAGPQPTAAIRTGSPISAIAAAPDGSAVAAACADGRLRIYDASTHRLVGGCKVLMGFAGVCSCSKHLASDSGNPPGGATGCRTGEVGCHAASVAP